MSRAHGNRQASQQDEFATVLGQRRGSAPAAPSSPSGRRAPAATGSLTLFRARQQAWQDDGFVLNYQASSYGILDHAYGILDPRVNEQTRSVEFSRPDRPETLFLSARINKPLLGLFARSGEDPLRVSDERVRLNEEALQLALAIKQADPEDTVRVNNLLAQAQALQTRIHESDEAPPTAAGLILPVSELQDAIGQVIANPRPFTLVGDSALKSPMLIANEGTLTILPVAEDRYDLGFRVKLERSVLSLNVSAASLQAFSEHSLACADGRDPLLDKQPGRLRRLLHRR